MLKPFLYLLVRPAQCFVIGCCALCASACHQAAPSVTPAAHDAQAHGTQHGTQQGMTERAPAAAATPRVPDYHADLAAARPLPKTLPPAQFTSSYVQAAYRIAERYPEVLAQQPCYCYCDTGFGHKSLLDCHVDTHSAECMVCMKEALLAGKLHLEGKSAEQIRAAIINGEWQGVQLQ